MTKKHAIINPKTTKILLIALLLFATTEATTNQHHLSKATSSWINRVLGKHTTAPKTKNNHQTATDTAT
jgi:hypothetical protein